MSIGAAVAVDGAVATAIMIIVVIVSILTSSGSRNKDDLVTILQEALHFVHNSTSIYI